MQPEHPLAALAASLSQQVWTAGALTAHLRLRLPQTFLRAASTLAKGLIRAFPGPVAPDPGLTVNDQVNIPRAAFDRLKATLHHLRRPEDRRRADPVFLARLSGQIAWVEQVAPARGARLRAAFAAL